MTLKLGELCAGYGGLGLAVEEALGAELAWYSEFDAAPSKIMATHWPDVPNHGDMTLIDWAAIEPVDIISGGTPCQDLSAAGRRKGMTEGTRSNLWVNMREAIATIKPTYVVWENVRGAYSAKAVSDLEFCPGCMGGGERADEHVLRALGRVLGDLSDLGYDTQWRGLRAADVMTPTQDSGSSSWPLFGTTTARMWKGSGPVGSKSHDWLMDHGNVEAQVLLLPTPRVSTGGMTGALRATPSDTSRLEDAMGKLIGQSTPRLFVAGKPCEEPPLPL